MGEEALARVLLVEDDPVVASATRRSLGASVACTIAESFRAGADALTVARSFDAVIVDIRLPDGSGIELVRRMRRAGDATPVLFVTAHERAETIHEAFALHARYLLKPVNSEDVRRFVLDAVRVDVAPVLDEVLARWIARHCLTVAETNILATAVRGVPRSALAAAVGTAEATLKTQISGLLAKTRDKSLGRAVVRLLIEARPAHRS